MKNTFLSFIIGLSIFASCQTSMEERKNSIDVNLVNSNLTVYTNKIDTTVFSYSWKENYNYKAALINNIELPEGFKRTPTKKNTYAAWLQHLPLSLNHTVYLFNGELKDNQQAQYKVLDIDIGNKDLQQCADAVMRLRAEYLYSSKQYDKIHFNYTNGVNIPFSKWAKGYYPSLKGNKVEWISSSNNTSYESFKKYINNIFMYAGTASLEKELKRIPLSEIQAGDVLIKGGFPGHAVIVLDVVFNKKTGNKAFLIAQSYMPAQSIHLLKNLSSELSPWYNINEISDVIETPEWTFYSNQLMRFSE